MWREIHYALRLLGKTPGFTALTVFVLAAGLGTALFMYVLVRQLAYAELPYADSDRFISVGAVTDGNEDGGNSISWHDYQQFSAEQTGFETFAFMRHADVMLSGTALPRVADRYAYSSSALFDLTAVPALLGRTLQPGDYAGDAPAVAVIGWQLWQSEFNGRRDVIGSTIKLDDEPVTVVGVMPVDYRFPDTAEIWTPLHAPGVVNPGDGPYGAIVGKLRKGVSLAAADAELKAIAKRLELQFPATNANASVKVWAFTQAEMTGSMAIIALMVAAAAFILLLVILNAGNLLLARAAERQKESAVRAALGAPRSRLVREMLWEAVLLAIGGGVIGLFFASWGLHWSQLQLGSMADALPFWWQFRFDSHSLWVALALVLLTAVLIGLYPALRASAGDINRFLRDGTRGAQGLQITRLMDALVISEIALSVALLIAALTLVASSHHTANADYGARTRGILTASLDLYKQQYDSPEQMIRFSQQLEAGVATLAGVEGSALSCHVPGRAGPVWTYQVEGVEVPDQQYPSATRVVTTDNYFKVYDIPLRKGRLFDSRDQQSSEKVAIISSAFAERNWPGQDPIGMRIDLDREHAPEDRKWYTVIGTVDKVIYGPPQSDRATLPELYLSYRQHPEEDMMISVATPGEPMALAHGLASEVARIDADLPLQSVMSLSERLARGNAGLRFIADMFLAFGGLGILLAGSGIYGIIARSVALRTQELGVRRALGASEQRVLVLLIKQGGLRFAIGGALGLALGLAMTQAVAAILYRVEGTIGIIAVAVLVLIGALVAGATWVPAWQAIKLSPAGALRYE